MLCTAKRELLCFFKLIYLYLCWWELASLVFQHPILCAGRKGQLDLKVFTNVGYLAFFKATVYTVPVLLMIVFLASI